MAVANYQDTHGHFPPPFVNGPDGKPWHSWRVLLLPFLEHGDLYKEYRFDEPWDGANNKRLAERMPRVYAFHGWNKQEMTITNYLAVTGEETVWPGNKQVSNKDISDGTMSTVLFVENLGAEVHWMEPRDFSLADLDLKVNSPAGVSSPFNNPAVVMVDGGLHKLRQDLKPEVLRALFTIRGGEALNSGGAGGWELLPDGRGRPLRELP